jgi:hypothetical protein
VALAGSDMTRPFICERISRSCGGGSVLSVREMASAQVRFGGRSAPGGSEGSALDCGTAAGSDKPFNGLPGAFALYVDGGALSPEPLSFDQSTRNFLPMTS